MLIKPAPSDELKTPASKTPPSLKSSLLWNRIALAAFGPWAWLGQEPQGVNRDSTAENVSWQPLYNVGALVSCEKSRNPTGNAPGPLKPDSGPSVVNFGASTIM